VLLVLYVLKVSLVYFYCICILCIVGYVVVLPFDVINDDDDKLIQQNITIKKLYSADFKRKGECKY